MSPRPPHPSLTGLRLVLCGEDQDSSHRGAGLPVRPVPSSRSPPGLPETQVAQMETYVTSAQASCGLSGNPSHREPEAQPACTQASQNLLISLCFCSVIRAAEPLSQGGGCPRHTYIHHPPTHLPITLGCSLRLQARHPGLVNLPCHGGRR